MHRQAVRARLDCIRYCPDPLGIVPAEKTINNSKKRTPGCRCIRGVFYAISICAPMKMGVLVDVSRIM